MHTHPPAPASSTTVVWQPLCSPSAHHLFGASTVGLHRWCRWRIPCWRDSGESQTPPGPVDPAAPPLLLAPSSPLWPISPLAPPGSLVPPALPWSVVDHLSPQNSTPLAAPRPSGSVRLLLPFGSSSVLCRSGSTMAFRIPTSASVT